MNSFKTNLNNETLVSTGRAGLEVGATVVSLAVLLGKGTAAAWHTWDVGAAARDQDLVSTLRFEGTTKAVLVEKVEKAKSYLTPVKAEADDLD